MGKQGKMKGEFPTKIWFPGCSLARANEKKVPKVFSASNRVLRSYSALLMILSFDIVFAYGHIYDGKRRE